MSPDEKLLVEKEFAERLSKAESKGKSLEGKRFKGVESFVTDGVRSFTLLFDDGNKLTMEDFGWIGLHMILGFDSDSTIWEIEDV